MDNINHKCGQLKKEIEIMIPFIKEPWRLFTFNELKQITGKTSHHYLYNALETFSKSVISKEKKGNTNTYRINEKCGELDYFVLAEIAVKKMNPDIPYKIIENIEKKIKSSYYTLMITGSFAENKQTKKSDLDLVLIIPNIEKKTYEIALKDELSFPEIHGFVFTENEFYEMLVNKEFNYGKEIVKKHIIIRGADSYYRILMKGLQNGFKG